ncbi:hypothetical protein Taro_035061 [Colocasia esculenta]|uniref:Uncharacterized protein n=1 Tax=Colocasia esculenta TaxID=4460 RepID=A0A843W4N5_COLES|nr:hypothetical protein [Colocasia esculenta]
MMQCVVHPKEYSRVSTCTLAKEMWDKLELIYEGTSEVEYIQVKYPKSTSKGLQKGSKTPPVDSKTTPYRQMDIPGTGKQNGTIAVDSPRLPVDRPVVQQHEDFWKTRIEQ